ncbi:hypothetical protein HCG49_09495 [Arenibacter sp. 6A1]|uniref:hypothetical protein n=1 Tax=Arenibacter sp. 6A1 TaxID=2720391 RepID=UPI00144723AE|nr:hypothetical protein [Arenibacter sp. 6A1]NKI26795.1 hypothetical protein [Arenibacter sp. 6A1]
MKKMLFLMFTAIALLSSCDTDNDINFHYEALEIKSVEMPESFNRGDIYTIKVTYLRPDNCTYFEGFDVVREEVTTRNIVAVAAVFDNEEECVALNTEQVATFKFEVLYQDPYLFRYRTGKDENGEPTYLEITVPVNDPSTD